MERSTSDQGPLRGKPTQPAKAGATNVVWSESLVDRSERTRALGLRGATVWMTGLPASGKSTIGRQLERVLIARGIPAYRLDGDNLRHGLNADLGFSAEARAENVRRTGEAAILLADAGVVAIACLVSPYLRDRDRVRNRHAESGVPFYEVFVDTPLALAESRDPKGHYKKARAGEMKGFTGIDDPYEAPPKPDLRIETQGSSVEACVERIVAMLAPR